MAASVNPGIFLCLLWIIFQPGGARAEPAIPPAYQEAGLQAGVPPVVLFAIALQESGINFRGRHVPWPWSLNIAGRAHRFSSRRESCRKLQDALRTVPATRVDAGLGQINFGYHRHRVKHPCHLLDPYRNLRIAATILREQHTPGQPWLQAVGRYHRPAGGAPAARYRHRVSQHLSQLNKGQHYVTVSRGPSP